MIKNIILIAFVCLLTACSTPSRKLKNTSLTLDTDLDWYGDNREQLQSMIEKNINTAAIAAFDWDNTMMKNDVGDAFLFWAVKNSLIMSPKSWGETSPWLTNAAVDELNKNCTALPGSPLMTATNTNCADTILSIYYNNTLTDEKTKAWKNNYNHDTFEPSYAWASQLMAGYAYEELKKIGSDAFEFFHNQSDVGSKIKLGTKEFEGWIRIYDQMADLVGVMQRNGFDVWVVSASPQYMVEVVAERVGIPANRVIGVRSVFDQKGKLTTKFEGCGKFKNANTDIITYRWGKSCWIQKVIKPKGFVLFAAGDPDTDAFFVREAVNKLVINRNKPELMCHAYNNVGGNWLINPMFIHPKKKMAGKYNCQSFKLADQEDLVF